MVFFRHLRLRWRARRLQQKLDSPLSPWIDSKQVVQNRVNVKALRHGSVDAPASEAHHHIQANAPLPAAIRTFIDDFNDHQKEIFDVDVRVLRGLQRMVPCISHRVDHIVELFRHIQYASVKNEREWDRWFHYHKKIQAELKVVCDWVASSARLHGLDHKSKPASQLRFHEREAATVTWPSVLPYIEIWLMMTGAAMGGGALGLVVLSIFLIWREW